MCEKYEYIDKKVNYERNEMSEDLVGTREQIAEAKVATKTVNN